MSSVAYVPSCVEPHTNEVQMRMTPMHTLQVVADPTPLEILTHKRPACTGRIAFNSSSIDLKKYFYDMAATIALNLDGVFSYILATDSVAKQIRLFADRTVRPETKKCHFESRASCEKT
jgi:hypothetical protein